MLLPLLPMTRRARLLLLLALVSQARGAQRWLLHGGYTGYEGTGGATTEVELLSLSQSQYWADDSEWCRRNITQAPQPLDGATIAEVSTYRHIDSVLAGGQATKYTSPHHSAQFHRILVCGGADDQFVIQNSCWWWLPERDQWEAGPGMLFPRYQAAAISWPGSGMVWMLGGRSGSTILQDNEVLHYPMTGKEGGGWKEFTLNRWEWAHKKMKNIEVWDNGVPADFKNDPTKPGMKKLPIPLTGLCAVDIGSRQVLVIGGGTTEVKADGTFSTNSAPIPTDHIHMYHNAKWSSTYVSELVQGTKALSKMQIARMNHACLKVGNEVYVAGGVTRDSLGQSLVLNKVEIYNIVSNTWRFAADLPKLATGFKLIKVNNRPTVVGRYGDEQTNVLLRYSDDQTWEPLSTRLLLGRSDFQVLSPMPDRITMNPIMNSKSTKVNPCSPTLDPCTRADADWRNTFGSVEEGVRKVLSTNSATQPWIQLDLGMEMQVKRVWFEGDGTAQDSKVRLGKDSVAPGEGVDVPLPDPASPGGVCGNVDGSATGGNNKQYINCPAGRTGRYISLQLEDSTPDTQLKIANIKVEVAVAGCPG